jgi:hypothetical protein
VSGDVSPPHCLLWPCRTADLCKDSTTYTVGKGRADPAAKLGSEDQSISSGSAGVLFCISTPQSERSHYEGAPDCEAQDIEVAFSETAPDAPDLNYCFASGKPRLGAQKQERAWFYLRKSHAKLMQQRVAVRRPLWERTCKSLGSCQHGELGNNDDDVLDILRSRSEPVVS